MTEYRKYPGSAYTVSFSSTSISSGVSLFPFQAGANTRVVIEEIYIGIRSSDPGNAVIQLYRGSTTPVSTTAVATLVNLDGWANASTAGSACGTPTTGAISTTSASLLDTRTLEDGYHYEYRDEIDILLVPSQRFDVVISSAGSFAGTLKIREVGKNPKS